MELKSFFKRFFSMSTSQPVETPTLYDLYGTSDVIVMRERKKAPSEDDAKTGSSAGTKRDQQ